MTAISPKLCFIAFCLHAHALALHPSGSLDSEVTSAGGNSSYSLVYECSNNKTITLADRCDGVDNCGDQSDESDCEDEGLLLYSVGHRRMPFLTHRCDLIAVHLASGKEFTVVPNIFCNEISSVVVFGPHVYYPGQLHLIRVNRNNSGGLISYGNDRDPFLPDVKTGTDMAIDGITKNFYLVKNQRIQVCSANLLVCSYLHTKFAKKVTSLALSAEHKKLFWIDNKSDSNFHIVTSYMDGSHPMVIQRHLASASYLIADSEKELLYWSQMSEIYCSKFDGTDKKVIASGLSLSNSFAVFKDSLYWINNKVRTKQIFTCNMSDCLHPVVYKNFTNDQTVNNIFAYDASTHRAVAKEHNPCENASCSDLCLLSTGTNFSCVCNEDPSGDLSPNKMYCDGSTVIATYGSDLYVIGNVFSGSPRIRKNSLGIAVSALAYDSINGNVILAEAGQQKLYLMTPRSHHLKVIVSDGVGTINCLKFDEYGNNIYWINPEELQIKVFSLNTFQMKTVLQGNTNYVPTDLTLNPAAGFMYVSFLKTDITTIESISMDGQTGSVVHYEEPNRGIGTMTLLYIQEIRTLIWADRETEEIQYADCFQGGCEAKFSNIKTLVETMDNEFSNSLTLLNNNILWVENTPDIYWHDFRDFRRAVLTHRLRLGVEKAENKTLKIASVKTTKSSSPCHVNNGKCEHLCLASESLSKMNHFSTDQAHQIQPHAVGMKIASYLYRSDASHRREEGPSPISVCACAMAHTLINSTICKPLREDNFTEHQPQLNNSSSDAETLSPTSTPSAGRASPPNRSAAIVDTEDDHRCSKPNTKLEMIELGLFMMFFVIVGVGIVEAIRRWPNFCHRARPPTFRARLWSSDEAGPGSSVTLESCTMQRQLL